MKVKAKTKNKRHTATRKGLKKRYLRREDEKAYPRCAVQSQNKKAFAKDQA